MERSSHSDHPLNENCCLDRSGWQYDAIHHPRVHSPYTMPTWTMVVAILGLRIFPFVRTAVIEKANVLESPREYYERIKQIPVDDITQEVNDISFTSSDEIQQLLFNNPLLRQLSMFSTNTTQNRSPSMPKEEAQGTQENASLPLKRSSYNSVDNNFDADYERINETYFKNADADIQHEVRRQPTGRILSDLTSELPNEFEYGDEEPFAVTESLLNSLAQADKAVIQTEIERLSSSEEGQDHNRQQYQAIPLDSSASMYTPQKALIETLTPTTTPFKENHIDWSVHYQATTQREPDPPTLAPPLKATTKSQIQPGLKKSLFQGMFYVPEDVIDAEEKIQEINEVAIPPKLKPSTNFQREGNAKHTDGFENTVTIKREQGGYLVSGTRYYFDNRINGDVHVATLDPLKEDYGVRDTSKEQTEMMQDPRFAVEVELLGMKTPKPKKYSQEGIKLYKNKNRQVYYEPEPPSNVSLLHLGDRIFERRVTEIGGKKITVDLANKHLHGVDLIIRPGSVVHGPLPYGEEKDNVEKNRLDKRAIAGILIPYAAMNRRLTSFDNSLENSLNEHPSTVEPLLAQSQDAIELPHTLPFAQSNPFTITELDSSLVETCFLVRTDTQLIRVSPIARHIGQSEPGCIVECARNKRCHSVNYSGTTSTCEIFDEIDPHTMEIKYKLGYTFYMPKRSDVHRCLNDVLQLEKGSISYDDGTSVICDENPCEMSAALDVMDGTTREAGHYRLLPSKAECPQDTAVLFIRSARSHNEKGSNLDTVSDVTEDDCLFSCLTNQAVDSHPVQCASAEYDAKGSRCTLSPDPRANELTEHPTAVFYEKICVARSVSDQCSGAAVDRVANMVIIGYMRDTATTFAIEECIERCVQAEVLLGFQCLSIMYYYNETILNCILNDASVRTNPDAATIINSPIVDYFGIDDCYGLPEATDDRQNFLKALPDVSDNNIGTEQATSSRPEVRRAIRSISDLDINRHRR